VERPEKHAAVTSTLLDTIAIVIGWLGFALWVGHGVPVTAYDAIRDMAYAQAIRHGHLWEDPCLPGFAAWYPPGNALLFAGLSALTRLSVVDLYTTSLYWLGWVNPLALYLLVRAVWGRATALLALPMVFLGSFWWLTGGVSPQASMQGLSLGLLSLLAWTHARRGTPLLAIPTGALVALAIWHHPLCGGMALGSILVHGVVSPILRGNGRGTSGTRPGFALRALGTAGLATLLAAPVLWHQLRLPKQNLDPYQWFAPVLHDPRFALHLHAPLVVPLGILGLWLVVRRWREEGWLAAYFAIGLAGQVAGYLGKDAGWSIPWVLPHEFQWHEQVALMIAAAVAIFRLADLLARRVRRSSQPRLRWVSVFGLLALSVGPALPHVMDAGGGLLRLDRRSSESLFELADWVRGNTPFESVFVCTPSQGFILCGLTGRKCIALPSGHMNPAADIAARYADLAAMMTTNDPSVFEPLAARYGATYLVPNPTPGTERMVRDLYGRWSFLELVRADTTALVYRIRHAEPR
jgi:hypothetical protein